MSRFLLHRRMGLERIVAKDRSITAFIMSSASTSYPMPDSSSSMPKTQLRVRDPLLRMPPLFLENGHRTHEPSRNDIHRDTVLPNLRSPVLCLNLQH
ncbi:uncharacterized protein FMAN_00174 [Fusarium mangiferae]|uniref:Uncharacterized protein n=1 Tax=Fusarium mangiferae TaxID=192010 RepID=A0A1L7U580_FUSMA|nr:uncharacterized protein FMAN_00174 [Fusarium mangiferae]CVL02671.1 uncharacterized protein FMAN_00174 [Fusarium mangiferae]